MAFAVAIMIIYIYIYTVYYCILYTSAWWDDHPPSIYHRWAFGPGGDEGAFRVGAQEESLGKRSWTLRGKASTSGDLMVT